MGALHQVNTAYYITSVGRSTALNKANGSDNELGFAVGGGVKLNAPMIGQGDYFQMQVNYTQGALRYIFQTPNSNWAFSDGAERRLRHPERWRLRRLCLDRHRHDVN